MGPDHPHPKEPLPSSLVHAPAVPPHGTALPGDTALSECSVKRICLPAEIVIQGSEDVGTIILLPQRHYVAGMEFDPVHLREVGVCQYHILCELERRNLTAVFKEGLTRPILRDDAPLQYPARAEIRRLFSLDALDPRQASSEQLAFLGRYGAGVVWWGLRTDVDLLPTSDPEFEACIDDRIKDPCLSPADREAAQMRSREQRAIECIGDALLSSPGRTVALVFGGGHVFGPKHFGSSRFAQGLPSLLRVEIPPPAPLTYLRELLTDAVPPERQLAVLNSVPAVYSYEVYLLTNLCALELGYQKLVPNPRHDEAFELLNNIRKAIAAASGENSVFAMQVEVDYREQRGPFTGLFPRAEIDWPRIPHLSVADVSTMIIEESHGPTQRKLVALAIGIDDEAFDRLCAGDLQLRSISKLKLGYWLRGDTPDQVLAGLRRKCRTPEVRAELDRCWPLIQRQLTDNAVPYAVAEAIPHCSATVVGFLLAEYWSVPSQAAIIQLARAIDAQYLTSISSPQLRLRALPKIVFDEGTPRGVRRQLLLEADQSPEFERLVSELEGKKVGPFTRLGSARPSSLSRLFRKFS